MSNLFASRKGPLLIAAGLFGGLLYYTYGGTQQPRPRQNPSASATGNAAVSETLQGVAGTGGPAARNEEQQRELAQYDPKDTRLHSADPSAQAKRNPQKVRSDDLGSGR